MADTEWLVVLLRGRRRERGVFTYQAGLGKEVVEPGAGFARKLENDDETVSIASEHSRIGSGDGGRGRSRNWAQGSGGQSARSVLKLP